MSSAFSWLPFSLLVSSTSLTQSSLTHSLYRSEFGEPALGWCLGRMADGASLPSSPLSRSPPWLQPESESVCPPGLRGPGQSWGNRIPGPQLAPPLAPPTGTSSPLPPSQAYGRPSTSPCILPPPTSSTRVAPIGPAPPPKPHVPPFLPLLLSPSLPQPSPPAPEPRHRRELTLPRGLQPERGRDSPPMEPPI